MYKMDIRLCPPTPPKQNPQIVGLSASVLLLYTSDLNAGLEMKTSHSTRVSGGKRARAELKSKSCWAAAALGSEMRLAFSHCSGPQAGLGGHGSCSPHQFSPWPSLKQTRRLWWSLGPGIRAAGASYTCPTRDGFVCDARCFIQLLMTAATGETWNF